MMKVQLKTMLVLCMVAALSVSIRSVIAEDNIGFLNVRDFGAKGDGNADDTKALQAAFDAVRGQSVPTGYVAGFTGSPVLFPSGVYKVTDSINIGSQNVIMGIGKPFIVMENPEKDIFTTTNAWRMDIKGLQFKGGRTQLVLKNPNLDTGMITIEDCRFNDSNGVAIADNMKSTVVYIRNCHFLNCEQVLLAHTDMVTLRDSWITTKSGVNDKAVIENYSSQLLLENICGVPLVGGRNLRWVDNYGELTANQVRFGGEGGGITPVYNYARANKELMGSKILIDHSLVCALGNPAAPAAVYCIEIPNKIEIRSSTLAGVKPIIVNKKIDLNTYFTGVDPNILSFVSRDNIGIFRDDIPELLQNPVCPAGKKEVVFSDEEVVRRLADIVKKVKMLKTEDDPPYTFAGHTQKTNPAEYVDLSPENYHWDLDDYMDGVKTKNSYYLAMATAGNDVVIMKRVGGFYPHVLIRDVKVDLDKTPWLTWKQKDVGAPEGFAVNPAGYAVRVIDRESGAGVLLGEWYWQPFFNYCAYNLKEKFGLQKGVHTFDIRFYYLGDNFIASDKVESARPGDYIVLDFMRLEKE